MKRHITILFFILLPMQNVSAEDLTTQTAVFNQNILKTLVSIEQSNADGKYAPIGTGFLLATPHNHIALITAKHVAYTEEGKGSLRPNLAYRLNETTGTSQLLLDKVATQLTRSDWMKSPRYDIACRLIIRNNTSDVVQIPYSMFLQSKLIQAGAPLFMIGFPLGLRSEQYSTPIVRRAIVGRTDPGNIIVDGFAYPGNSGSPIFYEPSLQLGPMFKSSILQGDWLLGVVVSEISFDEPAISPITNQVRVIFSENTGLSNVVPMDCVKELLDSPEFRKYDEALALP